MFSFVTGNLRITPKKRDVGDGARSKYFVTESAVMSVAIMRNGWKEQEK
jgi:hypothetical protein